MDCATIQLMVINNIRDFPQNMVKVKLLWLVKHELSSIDVYALCRLIVDGKIEGLCISVCFADLTVLNDLVYLPQRSLRILLIEAVMSRRKRKMQSIYSGVRFNFLNSNAVKSAIVNLPEITCHGGCYHHSSFVPKYNYDITNVRKMQNKSEVKEFVGAFPLKFFEHYRNHQCDWCD